MIKGLKLVPISLESAKGTWTYKNRKKKEERSVIDYILVSERLAKQTTENIVDEDGLYRIKGKVETDHNTIAIEIKTEIKQEKSIIHRWKLNNKDGWKKYNEKEKSLLKK